MALHYTRDQWKWDVEEVKEQLIKGGMPPYDAAAKACDIVSARRREAARKNSENLPDDIRKALLG